MLDVPGLRDRTDNAFRWALFERATAAGLNPSYIAAVIRLESNFDPNVQNALGAPALGLVQFWKTFFTGVARKAGQPRARWEDLRTSTALQQIPFVIANFTGKRLGPSSTPGDYYMANFMPAFVGRPPNFVLGEKDSTERLPGTNLEKGKVYAQNFGLDADGDGRITVGDVGAKIGRIVAQAEASPPLELEPEPVDIPPLAEPAPDTSSGGSPSSGSESEFSSELLARLEPGRDSYLPFKFPPLRNGVKGVPVLIWQGYLNKAHDAGLEVDGFYGPKTTRANVKHMGAPTVQGLDWLNLWEVLK